MRPFRTRSVTASHTGLVRQVNEDSLLARDDLGVWLVADGMGGHAHGQWASATIVERIQAMPPAADLDAAIAAVAGAIQAANDHIFRAAQQQGASMGSTAVALCVQQGRFACVWAGDSRAYLLRDGQLHRISTDHTQVQAMVDRGLLTPEQAIRHPMAHVLSRAVGVEAVLELDVVVDEGQPGDIYLLCSDGLYGLVSDAEIAERLARHSPSTACDRMIDLVLSRGAPDNVSIVVVTCQEITALNLAPANPA